MRNTLFFLVLLAGCAQTGNPFTAPLSGIGTFADDAGSRGQVEVYVKSNHPALIDQINAGRGDVLNAALDTAQVPVADRPARIIQMQSNLGLYAANPGALVTALMVYGR